MTEKETKEDTIHKLTSLSWQRKLNARNSLSKCVNGDSDQYWNYSKPNSESRFNEMKQEDQIHQTQVFKSRNDLTVAPKQNRDGQRENENLDYQKKLVADKESVNDQRYEQQSKNRNNYNGQNYRKDEKENVNVQRNMNRANPGNQNHSLNQRYFKQNDNQNFRRDGNYGNESTNRYQNNESSVQNQRNFKYQSRNYNQNNRGHHRNYDKSNYQSNHQRNDAKNHNIYQNNRSQAFSQIDDKTEQSTRKNEPFKRNNGNSFSESSNYLKPGTSPENSTSGIHYQRTFSSKMMNRNCTNVTNNQSANSSVGKKFIPESERFAELDLSSENGSSVKNACSNDGKSRILSQFTNFNNTNNVTNDLLSDHFTAGISEPIITNVHQNDTYRNIVQLNQQPNIPDQTVNFVNNYMSSNQSMISDNYTDCSHSNQVTDSTLVANDQCQFMDQITPAVAFSSLSPEVADFVPRRNQIQNSNQLEFSSPLIDHHHREPSYENSYPLSFSTPNSGQSLSKSWLSQNISGCNENIDLGNNNFQNCIGTPSTFSHHNSTEESIDILNRPEVNQRNSTDGLNNTFNRKFSLPIIRNSSERQDNSFGSPIVVPTNHRNSNERLNDNFGPQIAASINYRNSNDQLDIFNSKTPVPVDQCDLNELDDFNQSSTVPALRPNSNETSDIFNRLPTPVSDTSTCQTFNFNGRIVNLCDKQNQIDASQHPPSYDNVRNLYPYQDDSIGNGLNYSVSMSSNSGANNFSENLNFSGQQMMTNLLQMLKLNQNTPASSSSQPNNDISLSNLNVDLNENIIRQTNASTLSENVANSSSNRLVCNVMQNSRVNVVQDYYNKSVADAVNNLTCNESEKMDSQYELVAQQLLNVNNCVTSAGLNSGTITMKDSVCDTNSGQFNIARYERCRNEMQKYRQAENFANDNSLLSNNLNNQTENMFTPASIESSKSYDTFSSQTFVNAKFNRNQERKVDVGSRYNDGTTNSDRMVPNEFATNVNPSRPKMNDFQNNYGRNSVPNNSNTRYRYANTNFERNTSPKNYQNSFKNDFNRSNNNRRTFSNQVRNESNESAKLMSISIRDDSFINFTQKARPGNNQKFLIAEAPSVGILKKPPPKPLLSETSIQFQKSPIKDQNLEDSFISPKESPTFNNKRVSFLLENDQQ